MQKSIAYYHLPGLFEFYELYRRFLPLYREHREYFYDWCEIGSIYGAPADCLWGGGRVEAGQQDPASVRALLGEYGISARLTFSNSLLRAEHLADRRCNDLCRIFAASKTPAASQSSRQNFPSPSTGIIIHSDLLLEYLKEHYPAFYFISSTTKVLTDYDKFREELDRPEFRYVVPDYRLNKAYDKLAALSPDEKNKVEFLCNECCPPSCAKRRACYESVSALALGEIRPDHVCPYTRAGISSDSRAVAGADTRPDSFAVDGPAAGPGYRFSAAMQNPTFIGIDDICNTYLPMGFTNFKIEGRGLGSALILEFLLYYMTKPEYQLRVREAIYLDNMLDLF